MSNFQVIELGHEYVVQYSVDLQHDMEGVYGKYTKKVAFLWLSSESDDFVLLALHNYGIMAIYRSRDKQWSALENTHEWFDFISFNGKFYGLDQMGRPLVVEPSSKVSVLPHVVHLGPHCMKKLLVESGDQLLMIDVYLNKRKWKRSGFPDEITERLGSNAHKMMAWFDVFKLDEAGLKWGKVESLGDRLLFLGDYCTFSTSASEFSGVEGNHIIFTDFDRENLTFGGAFKERDMCVFSLENGTIDL